MSPRILDHYLTAVFELYSGGEAREESYYGLLERLILKIAGRLKEPSLKIIIMPKKTDAGNPDLVIRYREPGGKSEEGIVGYMEAKAPGKNLEELEDSPQIRRYREVFPNFILTNFLEFRWYREGTMEGTLCIGSQAAMIREGRKPEPENEDQCLELFAGYLSYRIPVNVYNARELARELAKRTRFMRDYVVMPEMDQGARSGNPDEENHILGFYQAFKKYLIHDLSKKDFADLYSQTLTFGLFTAATRCHRFKEKFKRETALRYIPYANGILHDLFEFISLGQVPPQLKCIMEDMVHLINRVDTDNILNEFFFAGKGEDPVHHFYETFLGEYDPLVREKRGVYYTPRAVVYFIVKSLHRILQKKLNRPDGLADTGLNILDPAAGTSTFMAETAQLAVGEYEKKYGRGAKVDFARHYLLNNLYGFELMMAPYAMAYLKMALILDLLGGHLKEKDRFNIFLTNALEMEEIEQTSLPGMSTLSRESQRAGQIKKNTRIDVILGNPPYAGHSLTKSEINVPYTSSGKKITYRKVKTWIGEQLDAYKRLDGERLLEKNLKWLQDDYVKFIRFAQVKIDENGEGVVGLVTNHSYLDNPTFRGMRRSLLASFNEIYILNLHGNVMKKEKCPDGSRDENVFDIRQGVAIAFFIKKRNGGEACRVFYADLWGLRDTKYELLGLGNIGTIKWQQIFPGPDFYLLVPGAPAAKTREVNPLYEKFFKVNSIFPVYSVGIVTARDKLTIRESKDELYQVLSHFSTMEERMARRVFNLGEDSRDWQVRQAQQDVSDSETDPEKIVPILYRPFDLRYTYYTGKSRGFLCMPRPEVMKHMLPENLGLITVRQVAEGKFNHCFVADTVVESRITTSNKGIAYLFPLYLYLYPNRRKRDLFSQVSPDMPRQPNIHAKMFDLLRETAGFHPLPGTEQVFYYIYGVLFSPLYRETYATYLKIDFPRIPFPANPELFTEMARLGKRLADLHLMKSPELEKTFSKFEIQGDHQVRRIHWMPAAPGDTGEEGQGRIYINKKQYFSGVSREMWEYKLCGYPVLARWLKDRRGRVLNCEELKHYIRIAGALRLTLRYQQEIDRLYPLIEKHLLYRP